MPLTENLSTFLSSEPSSRSAASSNMIGSFQPSDGSVWMSAICLITSFRGRLSISIFTSRMRASWALAAEEKGAIKEVDVETAASQRATPARQVRHSDPETLWPAARY